MCEKETFTTTKCKTGQKGKTKQFKRSKHFFMQNSNRLSHFVYLHKFVKKLVGKEKGYMK